MDAGSDDSDDEDDDDSRQVRGTGHKGLIYSTYRQSHTTGRGLEEIHS